MSDGVLSQEEIDALLRSDALVEEMTSQEPEPVSEPGPYPQASSPYENGNLGDVEKDAVGEVANIVMGSAATALSTLLGRKVEITTPVVELTDPEKLRKDFPLPYVLVNVEYVTGLTGSNVLIIRDKDAGIMVDLMMNGDGQSPPEELSEMHLSAICEAMNQMMGSASTAMSTIIKERVEISPPTVETINFANEELKGNLGQKGLTLVRVSFRMTIEGLIDSQIMQLIPLGFAKEMVKNLLNDVAEAELASPPGDFPQTPVPPQVNQNANFEIPQQVVAAAEPAYHQPGAHMFQGSPVVSAVPPVSGEPAIPVQPVQFAPIQPAYQPKEIANIDLILDVPLQITVELGKSRKTIREILALTPGSVVELDKLAGEPVDLLVNGKLLAKGEVVVIDENFGIRVTDIISPLERVSNLQ